MVSGGEKQMKRLLVFVIMTALLAAATLGMTGCAAVSSAVYDNAEKYAVGDAEISGVVENI